MIRINLLPVKAAKRREQGQRQLLIGVMVLSLALVTIIVFHGAEVAKSSELRGINQRLSTDISRLKTEIGDYDVIKAQRDELIRQREAIKRLQANRAGPVWLMRELSDILTKGKGPTFNKEQYEDQLRRDPNTAFNPNWEPKRVWLVSYAELNHEVKLRGAAKSDEDVAEFLKRLKLSAFFSDVYWQQTQPQTDQKMNNVSFVTFDVAARVNY
jgi:type IV pilus assembly protein PilN